MIEKKRKSVFIDGPVSATFIANSISGHQSKTNIGAHSIFLGQVRTDEAANSKVAYIEYTAYHEMAEEKFHEIREDAFARFNLTCMHIYHSLGKVASGEISLFVFTSSKHRTDAINACSYIVERIKAEAPVWGLEFLENGDSFWKKNSV